MVLQYFEEKKYFLSKCLFYLFIKILCAKILCVQLALADPSGLWPGAGLPHFL